MNIIEKFHAKRILADILLFFFLVFTSLFLVKTFVSQERAYYFWDFSGYQRSAVNQVLLSYESRLRQIRVAFNSLDQDYNALWTIPIVHAMRFLGNFESRQTYILSLGLVFTLPYLISLGF